MDAAELRRQVEHKFAPEPLLAVQALANTYDFETEEERLGDPAQSRAWLVGAGLAAEDVAVGAAEHRRLRELRMVVRRLLDTHASGVEDPEAGEGLSRLLHSHQVRLGAAGNGGLELDLSPQDTVDGVISQLLGIVFQAQVEGQWERLKICACDECRWAFYDSSRNRGGTWCQMEVCGNREKNRAYRRRSAAS